MLLLPTAPAEVSQDDHLVQDDEAYHASEGTEEASQPASEGAQEPPQEGPPQGNRQGNIMPYRALFNDFLLIVISF